MTILMPAMSPVRAKNNQVTFSKARNFSKEFRVMLACCREGDVAREEEPKSFEGPLDWERVLALADFHGVRPQLHRALNTKQVLVAPPAIRAELDQKFKENARKSLRLTAELFGVLDCLHSAGVLAVPFKGPVLAEALYGDLALREYSDIDVLVRAEDVSKSRDALREIGFIPSIKLSPMQERAYVANGYEYTLHGPAAKNLLEIQWNFVPRFFSVDFDMNAILGRCESVSVSGRSVPALSNEDLFMALCVHCAKHLWKRVCWVRDIAAMLQRSRLHWAHLQEEADRLGTRRIVAVSIQLAKELLGAEMVAMGDTPTVDAASVALCDQILDSGFENEEPDTESLEYFRWMLRLRKRVADRTRFVCRLAFTPSIGEWQVVDLPASLFPLYRAIRVGRLAGRLVGLR
jgi:Uncharacterised nucleotidyltransferase